MEANCVLKARVAEWEARLAENPAELPQAALGESYEKPVPKSRRERTGRRSGG